MEGIGGLTQRRDYTNEELDELRKDKDSGAILNKARHDAGFKDADVSVRGDDPTLPETVERGHINYGEAAAAVIDAVEVGGAVTGAHLGTKPEVALPVMAWVAAQASMYCTEKRKLEEKDAATRDQMHAAMLYNLELPAGFGNERIKELGVSFTNHSPADRISDQLQTKDKALLATLQLHCDQGMNSARDMIGSGQTKETFLKTHPAVAERYAKDVAFREGFDALEWAKKQAGSTYDDAVKGLESRDARNELAHITYRV